mmetsp:Transcript_11748/g.26213  ORF Transcript_11748/g.26213 Transcript_11748/m.26213 type:complete len:226 (-) Transcript_11748:277-954(-)
MPLLLLSSRQGLILRCKQVRRLLRKLLVLGNRFHLGCIHVVLHGFEVGQQLLKRLDDAPRPEFVVLHLDLRLLQEGHEAGRKLWGAPTALFQGRHDLLGCRLDLAEALPLSLGRLQGLDGTLQGLDSSPQVCRLGLVLVQLVQARFLRILHLALSRCDVGRQSRDFSIQLVPLAVQLSHVSEKGCLLVLPSLNSVRLGPLRVLAEACKFVVGGRLLLPLLLHILL